MTAKPKGTGWFDWWRSLRNLRERFGVWPQPCEHQWQEVGVGHLACFECCAERWVGVDTGGVSG